MTRPGKSSTLLHSVRTFLFWYIAALLILVVAMLLLRGVSLEKLVSALPRIARMLGRNYATWLFAFIPYLLFLLVKSLVRTFRASGVPSLFRALATRVVLPLAMLVLLWYGLRAYTAERAFPFQWDPAVENQGPDSRNLYEVDGKQRGVNLTATAPVTQDQLRQLLRDNIEWLTLVPFGWQEKSDRPELHLNSGSDYYWSETDSGIAQITRLAKDHGMKLMLKPHIWLTNEGRGAWVSEIGLGNEADWHAWFENYRKFIFHYAELAERIHIDVLCIGTELQKTVKEKPGDWRSIIAGIRRIYHGGLTYAANWTQELGDIAFWDSLDYIGVQAYYPLTQDSDPTVDALTQAWKPYVQSLEELSRRYNKPVLFTEIGWKSTSNAAIRPWEWPNTYDRLFVRRSTQTQANAYEAFFRTLWDKKWFAGAHIWKWYANYERAGGPSDIDFTPQNKPAENVIARWFGTVAGR